TDRAADEDEGDFRRLAPGQLERRGAVISRQREIGNDDIRPKLVQRFPESFLGLDSSPGALQAFPLEVVDGQLGLGSDILEYQQAQFLLHGSLAISFGACPVPYGTRASGVTLQYA